MHVYKMCVQRWKVQAHINFDKSWAILDQELTQF
jgi:hypothetical protein